jgi:hypothetical protein
MVNVKNISTLSSMTRFPVGLVQSGNKPTLNERLKKDVSHQAVFMYTKRENRTSKEGRQESKSWLGYVSIGFAVRRCVNPVSHTALRVAPG